MLEILAISGHTLKEQLYLLPKYFTPQVELFPQLGVFLHNTIHLDKIIGKPTGFDDLRLFIHPPYVILTIEI